MGQPSRVATGTACVLALMFSATLAIAQPPGPALRVAGFDGTLRTLGLAELRALPQIAVTDSSPETGVVRFQGPSVRALVSLVGAPEGHALRGPAMTLVVVAEASDGYRVAYSLAEIDEQFGGRAAIVALTQNGQPLPAGDGPLRIVVPGESHHARWIRQLTVLRLVQIPGSPGGTIRPDISRD